MNKLHATARRTPSDPAAILASIHCPVTRTWIAGMVEAFTIPRGALKHSSSLTSGFVLAPHGSPLGFPLVAPDPVRHPPTKPCAQIPIQPEAAPVTPVGTLRNGNRRGNPNAAPRCGGKTRAGCPCKGPAMKNGRCRMHGGASTGPSAEGRARIAAARTTHGRRTAAMRALDRTIVATKRRGTVLNAMAQAGLRVQDLAEPIRQCRGGMPLRDKPPTAERERYFAMRELMAMAFSAAQVRLLLNAIGTGAQPPARRAAPRPAQIPMHPEPAPKPPRQPLVCERPRLPRACRRLDPANPFPARIKPPATWGGAENLPDLHRPGLARRTVRKRPLCPGGSEHRRRTLDMEGGAAGLGRSVLNPAYR
jgi:hypothetical protein